MFNLALPTFELPSLPDDDTQTTYVSDMLGLFYNPSQKRINQGVRTIVAGVTFARMDTSEIPLNYIFPVWCVQRHTPTHQLRGKV